MTLSGLNLGQLRWLWLSVLMIALDLGTKALATRYLGYAQPVEVLPVFDLTLLHNTGAAFSFLSQESGWQRWLFSAIAVGVSIGLTIWLARLRRYEQWLACSLALVLGGALGNLYDRITLGYVVDFISIHYSDYYFPAFNVADSAITIGAMMLALDLFRKPAHASS